jgi:RNA polymerase sigma factor (TIGR02999 family)
VGEDIRFDSASVLVPPMNEVTRVLSAIERGDPHAAEQLLPLVYQELRRLAAQKLAQEKPGQTLEATALVHEAYLRLVDGEKAKHWNSRGHFFAAAAEAMRRILVDQARRKQTDKHGGGRRRVELPEDLAASEARSDDLIALDEVLSHLERHDADAARLVKLSYLAGPSHQEAAVALGISRGAADRLSLARACLFWPELHNPFRADVFGSIGSPRRHARTAFKRRGA